MKPIVIAVAALLIGGTAVAQTGGSSGGASGGAAGNSGASGATGNGSGSPGGNTGAGATGSGSGAIGAPSPSVGGGLGGANPDPGGSASSTTRNTPNAAGMGMPAGSKSEAEVRSELRAQGYTIDDLKQANGQWTARATKDGRRVDLQLDNQGRIITNNGTSAPSVAPTVPPSGGATTAPPATRRP